MPRTHINPGSRTFSVGWIGVLAMLGAAMVTAEIISGSMMPLMAEGLNTSEGMIGQAVTASAIVAIFTSLSIGKLCGNHDRRLILVVMSIFLAASNLGVALSPNVWSMLAARLLLGVAIGIVWGLMPAVVLRLAPEGEFPHAFASVVLGVAAAGVIAAPSAAYLGDLFSWRAVYAGATVLALLATVMLAVWLPSLPARPGGLNRDLRGTFRLPGLVAGMVGVMLMFGGMQTFFGYLVPFLESVTRLEPSGVSLTLLLYGLLGTAGNMVAPRSLKRSIRWTLVIASATMSVLLLVLLVSGSFFIPTLLALMVWAAARSHVGVGANSWLAHTFPDHLEGAGGILVAVIQGSMMIGAIIGGVLIDSVGASAPAAASALILGIGAVYIVYAMKPTTVHAPERHSPGRMVDKTVPITEESM